MKTLAAYLLAHCLVLGFGVLLLGLGALNWMVTAGALVWLVVAWRLFAMVAPDRHHGGDWDGLSGGGDGGGGA